MNGETTCDAFLGGRLRIEQPRRGYRAGVDPVLLAAAVPARAGERVLDLGCGVGAAGLCLGARVSGVGLTGIEVQPFYADLARRNAARNGIAMDVLQGDLTNPPASLRAVSFDHVITNPPYYRRENGPKAEDEGRETAFGEGGGWKAGSTRGCGGCGLGGG